MEVDVLVVRCPEVRTARGERLVSERRISGLERGRDGFVLTVRCVCGSPHRIHVGRLGV